MGESLHNWVLRDSCLRRNDGNWDFAKVSVKRRLGIGSCIGFRKGERVRTHNSVMPSVVAAMAVGLVGADSEDLADGHSHVEGNDDSDGSEEDEAEDSVGSTDGGPVGDGDEGGQDGFSGLNEADELEHHGPELESDDSAECHGDGDDQDLLDAHDE